MAARLRSGKVHFYAHLSRRVRDLMQGVLALARRCAAGAPC